MALRRINKPARSPEASQFPQGEEQAPYWAYPEESYPPEAAYPPEEAYPPEPAELPDEAYPPQGYDDPYSTQKYSEYPVADMSPEDYSPEAYVPQMDEYDIDMADDDMDLLDDESYQEEKKLRRIGRFRVAAGVMDFLGVIAGMVAVLVLIALLVSLVNWLHADILRTFTILQTRL